jgi:O-6-methylguanine DNA methyltransferase
MSLPSLARILLNTPDGVFTAHFSEDGLARLEFPSQRTPTVSGEADGNESSVNEPFHEPNPLIPSFSPSGGEGARRAVEGDSQGFMGAMRDKNSGRSLSVPSASDSRLHRLAFSGAHRDAATKLARWLEVTETALQQALRGSVPETLPPFDLGAGTAFQQSVWETLRRIPGGRTMTYGEVAKAIGRPQAMRAVGQACGSNPIPVLIPCHRVLAAHGGIGGFSGGLHWKIKLLGREGVRVTGAAVENLSQDSLAFSPI